MIRNGVLVLVIGAASAMALLTATQDNTAEPPAVSDVELGLRKTTLADDRVPPVFVFTDASPGDSKRLPRAFDGAPALIPHSLEGLLPITSSENTCLMCHQTGSTDPEDPPQVPRSHLTDLRAAPGIVREAVTGARWNCTACHVVQSNAPALVENRFGSPSR
jgi:nitrate reductase (cytochrome), electron transfer subunit